MMVNAGALCLKWMIAGIYALGAPSLGLLLCVAAKVGALG
jgi:hypothetical protein